MANSLIHLNDIYNKQQLFFNSGVTKSYDFRLNQLQKLKNCIKNHESEILEALQKDLNKSAFEGYVTEIGMVYEEINFAIKSLKKWMKPKRANTPLSLMPSSSKIYSEPLGIVLIIAPWNYPFQLNIAPLIAAISAGNTVILKPSELAVHTEHLLLNLITKHFDEAYIAVTTIDGPTLSNGFIRENTLGHIIYTGGSDVGKLIMDAAANQLTRVTLELGGKSPCIVTKSARLDNAANKVVWSKFTNAGQTCVAPDYLLVHAEIYDDFITKLANSIVRMYGTDAKESHEYPRIINTKHTERLAGLIDKGKLLYGGDYNIAERYIAPTLLAEENTTSAIMQNEIFGPLLPVFKYETEQDIFDIVNKHKNPLALYVYSEDQKEIDNIIKNIPFGGGCINNGLIHVGNVHLPFGGIGNSGTGVYHGKHGFDRLSHKKAIMRTASWFDIPVLYPPFKNKLKWVKKLIK